MKGFLRGRTNNNLFFKSDFSVIHKENLKKLANFFEFQPFAF